MKRVDVVVAQAALALALLGAAGTFAADKAKEASFGNGKSSGPILGKEQLRSCLAQPPRLARQDADLAKEQADLNATKVDISGGGDALKSQLEGLDRSSADAVAAYNEKAQAHDKQIDEYQARVTAFNSKVEANHADHESFNKGCENRRYLEEDEIAIRKGK
jgi:hypothetical protein